MTDPRLLLSDRSFQRKVLLPSTVVVILVVTGWLFWWPHWFTAPDKRTIHVSRGSSFKAIVDSLETSGIIGNKMAVKIAGRILGVAREMKVGKYAFTNGVSNWTILHALKDGSMREMIPLSLPEGVRLQGIARRIGSEFGGDSLKAYLWGIDSFVVSSYGVPGPTLEGYLLPDTYFFHWQTDEREIIDRLLTAFKHFYGDSLKARQEQLKLSLREVVTLASIVEAETQLPEELPIIAGVYHNRLRKRMRLEADPTIQYLISNGPRRILYPDLKIRSPYNTYMNYGLPPGPINNPGRLAILATLFPAKHEYLYFVADGRGGHTFSKSYAEHQRAVRVYRRLRRELQKTAIFGG